MKNRAKARTTIIFLMIIAAIYTVIALFVSGLPLNGKFMGLYFAVSIGLIKYLKNIDEQEIANSKKIVKKEIKDEPITDLEWLAIIVFIIAIAVLIAHHFIK